MRLTLRTLLAYMDDRLPPARAREIGLKIAQSAFAGELLERIREVKRRRRIATAAANTPTVDANLLSEYLDDQLSPDLVQRIEQKVLASDPLLAEVASAHELLGLLRDPIELEPKLRDRLSALDPTGVTDVLRASGKTSAETSVSAAVPWQPEVPRSSPLRYRATFVAAVLAVVWLLLLATDSSLFRRPEVNNELQLAAAEPAAEAEPAAVADPAEPAAAATAPTPNPEGSLEAPQAEPTEPPMAEVQPEQPVAAAADSQNQTKPPVEAATPAPAPADAPAEVENVLPPGPKSLYLQAENRIVMVADDKSGQWTNLLQIRGGDAVVPALNAVNCRPLLGNNWFGVPATFELGLRAAGQAWQAKTVGAGVFRFPDSPAELQILAGQLILTADAKQAWPEAKPPLLSLQTGTEQVAITLLSEQARVAVEVRPTATPLSTVNAADVPPAENDDANPASSFFLPIESDLSVRVTLLEGSAQVIAPRSAEPVNLNASEAISWRIVGGKESSGVERSTLAPATIPAWMLRSNADPIPEIEAVHKRVLDALAAPGVPGELVQPLLTDRNPQVGLVAADVLCLTADTGLLLAGLFEGLDESVHRRIIDGLRAAVAASVPARTAVAASLETRLSMADAVFAMQLISGLNETTARDRLITTRMLQYLQGDSLALRTLAIYEMERLTGGRQNYFPNSDASRRRDAVNRWQKAIDRNGGTLLP